MPFTETELKRHLKEAPPARLYLLYGREPYLTSHYADQVVRLAMGKDARGGSARPVQSSAFRRPGQLLGCHRGGGRGSPLMAERKCVVVRDFDVTAASVPLTGSWSSPEIRPRTRC